jgi:hypothetical protein
MIDWSTRVTLRPPQQQGVCDSCSSFALAAAIEAMWAIGHGNQTIAVSSGFIHTCLGNPGVMDPAAVCATPFDLGAACGAVQAPGGYAFETPGDYPFAPAACAAAAIAGQISGAPVVNDLNDAQTHLSNMGPVVAELYIWDDFTNYRKTPAAPAYVPDMATAGPNLHSVCVVGFDAVGWIIKNSYGPLWGDGRGYATVAFGSCGLISAPPPGGFQRQAFAIQL